MTICAPTALCADGQNIYTERSFKRGTPGKVEFNFQGSALDRVPVCELPFPSECLKGATLKATQLKTGSSVSLLSVLNTPELYAENKTARSSRYPCCLLLLPVRVLFLRPSKQLYVCGFDVIGAKRLLTKETVCSPRSKNVLRLPPLPLCHDETR